MMCGFFGFGYDVDIKVCQLRCQMYVLIMMIDGEGQLFFRYNYFDFVGFFVQNNFRNFSRLQCVYKEGWLIFVLRDDVDFFVLQFVYNGLYV